MKRRKIRRRDPKSALLRQYAELGRQFQITDESKTYSALVTAETNANYPVQRWFHFKEAYSVDLLGKLVTRWRIPKHGIRRILDPFCGIGTTLLAAQRLAKKWQLNLEAVGIDDSSMSGNRIQLHCITGSQRNDAVTVGVERLLLKPFQFHAHRCAAHPEP